MDTANGQPPSAREMAEEVGFRVQHTRQMDSETGPAKKDKIFKIQNRSLGCGFQGSFERTPWGECEAAKA